MGSLTDGRIYIRGDGESREANSEEFDLLIQRGSAGAQVKVDFALKEGEEIVLVVADSSLIAIRGTWELAARYHNNV